MSLGLACQWLWVSSVIQNSLELLGEGSGVLWNKDLLLYCWHCTPVGQISSVSIWKCWQNTCLHEHIGMNMIHWPCLYIHTMHLYLHCVQRHIKRGWFPWTDPPLCGMPWHYKQAPWRRRASVIVARGGGMVGAAGLQLADCVSLPACDN